MSHSYVCWFCLKWFPSCVLSYRYSWACVREPKKKNINSIIYLKHYLLAIIFVGSYVYRMFSFFDPAASFRFITWISFFFHFKTSRLVYFTLSRFAKWVFTFCYHVLRIATLIQMKFYPDFTLWKRDMMWRVRQRQQPAEANK